MNGVTAEVAERLTVERNVWLSTVRPDGSPHLVPTWFAWAGDRIWVATGARSVKHRNVAVNPRVWLSLQDGDRPVVAAGTVEIVARPFPDDPVAAFRDKYHWDVSVEQDPDIGDVALWAITVDRWVMTGSAG